MSIRHVNMISNRLSLRKPQRISLEILSRLCEISTLEKDGDTAKILKIVQSEYSHLKDFDRDFPSLCFALATGVGKTRLMGAFISYLFLRDVHINIFNISKITARDKGHYSKSDDRKSVPRIRRLGEYIGESYFDYLAGLDDLVVLMDESHRYRADAGMTAINGLKPLLGLELTATPQVERGSKTEPFQNVIYHYPLSYSFAL